MRAITLGTICATAVAAALNHISCIGACEPAPGAAGALQVPLVVAYIVITASLALPVAAALNKLGSAVAAAVVSLLGAALMTWLFYSPEVDSASGVLMAFGFLFIPWFIGGYVSVRMWPNKQ